MDKNNSEKSVKIVSVHLKIEQWKRLKDLARADGRCVYRQAEHLLGLVLKCGRVDAAPSVNKLTTGGGGLGENKI